MPPKGKTKLSSKPNKGQLALFFPRVQAENEVTMHQEFEVEEHGQSSSIPSFAPQLVEEHGQGSSMSSFAPFVDEHGQSSSMSSFALRLVDVESISHGLEDAIQHRDSKQAVMFEDPKDACEKDGVDKQKRKRREKGQWTIGRTFQADWVSKFPFILPMKTLNDEPPTAASCSICSWKLGREVLLQLKLDTIEKHIGKVYEEQEVDGKVIKIVRWKSIDDCRHVKYAALYEDHLRKIEADKEAGAHIRRLFDEKVIKDGQATMVQFVIVLHILSMGKPMADYPKWRAPLKLIGISVPTFPTKYWNEPSGWEFARFMAEVITSDLQRKLLESKFVAVSLDEVTARDATSWVCMNIYFVEKHMRHAMYLGISKLDTNATAESLVKLTLDNLQNIGGMTLEDICKKVVCVGVDGCSVMHGSRTGLCIRLQMSYCPYMLGIHCMAHRTNLAYKILKEFQGVQKVEGLVRKSFNFFSKSPKRQIYFNAFADGLTEGRKMLKYVDTRWISLVGPMERLFNEYKSVFGCVNELAQKKDKGQEKARHLLEMLGDIEAFLYLGGLLPMLHQMNLLIKIAQTRDIYVMEYTTARKMTCLQLETLYNEVGGFDDEVFKEWRKSFQDGGEDSYLKYDNKGFLCMNVKEKLIRLHMIKTTKKKTMIKNVRQLDFQQLISDVKKQLVCICKTLTAEIRDRFPRDELLESMAIVHPLYWNNKNTKKSLQVDFVKRIDTLCKHFGKQVKLDGIQVDGLLDSNKLLQQGNLFAETMWEQYTNVEEPSKPGAIKRLWGKLCLSAYLQEGISEYFKLVDLCQTMILGSIEDERVFSNMSFLRNQLRNRLNLNLDTCLRLFVAKPCLETFPYEEAYAQWHSSCERRGSHGATPSTVDESVLSNQCP